MKKKQNYNIPPTEEEIRRYLSGDMSDEERNAIERKLQYSSFFADGEEGLSQINAEEYSKDIKNLRNRLSKRTKNTNILSTRPYQVAAGLILTLIFSWLLIEFVNVPDQISKQTIPSDQNEASDILPDSALLSYEKEEKIKEEDQQRLKEEDPSKSVVQDDFEELQEKRIEEVVPEEEEVKAIENTDNEVAITEDITIDLDIADLDIAEVEAEPEIVRELAEEKIAAKNEEVRKRSADLEGRAAGVKTMPSMMAPAEEINIKPHTISGRIINPNDLTPLPGVNVLIKGTNIGTVSDIDGKFTLHLPDSLNNTLIFSFVGFETVEFDVKDQSFVEVALDSDVSQLSEVVVSGYGRTGNNVYIEPVIEKARPKNGFKAFKNYLLTEMQYPEGESEKRTVKLEFFVETDGSLSDIQITNMPGKSFEEEAIRLIKEGPKWVPATVDGKPQREKVKIKIRFKPPKE